jgi:SAM-dependent methyltransferase
VANDVDPFVRSFLDRYSGKHDRVLDVGCGPAPYRDWIVGSYVGLDNTDKSYGNEPRRVDVVASAEQLPIRSESIDLILSKSAFYLVRNSETALLEFKRVLKTEGRLLLLDYNRRTQKRMMNIDGSNLPCWTQWNLKAKLGDMGFRRCELLVPKARTVGRLEYWLRLLHQEFFGTWAIVTAVK